MDEYWKNILIEHINDETEKKAVLIASLSTIVKKTEETNDTILIIRLGKMIEECEQQITNFKEKLEKLENENVTNQMGVKEEDDTITEQVEEETDNG